jgi:hypothetical protein
MELRELHDLAWRLYGQPSGHASEDMILTITPECVTIETPDEICLHVSGPDAHLAAHRALTIIARAAGLPHTLRLVANESAR